MGWGVTEMSSREDVIRVGMENQGRDGDQSEDKEPESGGVPGYRVKARLEVFQTFSISGAGPSWMPVMDGATLQYQEVRDLQLKAT